MEIQGNNTADLTDISLCTWSVKCFTALQQPLRYHRICFLSEVCQMEQMLQPHIFTIMKYLVKLHILEPKVTKNTTLAQMY
jgi:hypothetical protein